MEIRRRFLLYHGYNFNCSEIERMGRRAQSIRQSVLRVREKIKNIEPGSIKIALYPRIQGYFLIYSLKWNFTGAEKLAGYRVSRAGNPKILTAAITLITR